MNQHHQQQLQHQLVQQQRTSFMQSPLVTWLKTLIEEAAAGAIAVEHQEPGNANDYGDLCKGFLLIKAWLQIDVHASHLLAEFQPDTAPSELASTAARIRNLYALLATIRNYYENVLDQILVLRLPDVVHIALSYNEDLFLSVLANASGTVAAAGASSLPLFLHGLINGTKVGNGTSLVPSSATISNNTHDNYNNICDDMQTLLLLILGGAVQCDNKEIFIEKIKQLDIGIQHSIVECIRQIHDNPDAVFLVSEWSQPPDDEAEKDRLYSVCVGHISRLTKERDQLYQRVVDLSCELLNLTAAQVAADSSLSNNHHRDHHHHHNNNLSSLNHCDQKSHYLVELADVKSKLRRLQQEVEEKNEIITELKEVIEQNKESCNKLRHENLELTQEARTAKAYRDEIDVLNERVRKIDRLEAEVQRYRDKMNELDYCKTRVEELREDNRILGETKTMLEEQLETSRKRGEKIPELEEKILKLNAYGNELNLQRELDRNQIERLIEEITHLRLEKKFANEELGKVQSELTDLRAQIRLNHETTMRKNEEGNLYDQMNQDTSKRLIKLEHENNKLQSLIEDYQHNYVDVDSVVSLFNNVDWFSASKIGTETPDTNSESGYDSNKSKIEKLSLIKEFISKVNLNCANMKSVENDKTFLEKEVADLKTKLQDSSAKLESMERNLTQATIENQKYQRIIEQKAKKFDELMSELEAVENENEKLVANADSLRLSLKKLNDLEIEMTNLETEKQRLEQANKSFEKEINRLKTSIDFKDQVIDENAGKLSNYELENKRLKKDIEMNGHLSQRLKEAEKENKDSLNALALQKKTLAALQRDLVEEKLKTQKFADEFSKIVKTLNKLCSLDQCPMDGLESKDVGLWLNSNIAGVINDCLQNLIEKFSAQKDSDIEELQARLHDLKENNQEMQTLINSLKRQLNIDEKSDLKSSLDSLNELQRRIFSLEDENRHLKLELSAQKECQMETDLVESKLNSVNETNAELKNKCATLEVENSLLKSQNSSLQSQTVELQEQMISIQDSIEKLKIKCEEYETAHRLLIADNESLQEIHQQLTADYETLTENHGLLKQSYKKLKMDFKSQEEELAAQFKRYEEFVTETEKELVALRAETERSGDSRMDATNQEEKIGTLTGELKTLNEEHLRLQTEHKMLQNIYKKLRSDNNDLKLKHTELQGETAECKDRMNALNVEVSKLSSYCEMVAMTNTTLETQRKKLATQSASLLTQYNDLLMELSCGCERSIKDRLHELFLKKERLEKMFKDYDISFEKNMSRVSNNRGSLSSSSGIGEGGTGALDDTIYGLLWEAETPPIAETAGSKFYNSTALLRQYSISSAGSDKDRKSDESSSTYKSSPPRIPPRQQQRQPTMTGRESNSTSIEFSPACILPSASMENKISLNISSSSGGRNAVSKTTTETTTATLEGHIAKLQITATSPFVAKSTISSPMANNNSNFTRGSFKSNSVNYGNLMRKTAAGDHNHHHGHYYHQKMIYGPGGGGGKLMFHSPQQQLCMSSPNNNLMNRTTLPAGKMVRPAALRDPIAGSPSASSSSSSSVHDDNGGQEATNLHHHSGHYYHHHNSPRSRITITSNDIGNIQTVTTTTTTNGGVINHHTKDSNQISIQISNALNNNSIGGENPAINGGGRSSSSDNETFETANNSGANANATTTGAATTNTNNNSGTNSIWYEYGCV